MVSAFLLEWKINGGAMGTVTTLHIHRAKLKERAQYAKDICSFACVCTEYLIHQDEKHWERVIEALVESKITNPPIK